MSGKNYHWNYKNTIFRSERDEWILFAGETGSFLKVSEDLKDELCAFEKNKDFIADDILATLLKIEAISEKSDEKLNSLHEFRRMRIQTSKPLTFLIDSDCLCSKDCGSIIESFISFCKQKNNRTIFIKYYGEKTGFSIEKIEKITKFLKRQNILAIQSLYSYALEITSSTLDKLVKNNFNEITFILTGENMENPQRKQKIFDNIEITFDYLNTKGIKINLPVLVEISNKNKKDFLSIRNYFEKRYGDFFKIDYTFSENIFGSPEELELRFINRQQLKKIYFLDKEMNISGRNLLKNISKEYFSDSQYLNYYVLGKYGLLYKNWHDRNNPKKSVYDLLNRKSINFGVEYSYILGREEHLKKSVFYHIWEKCNIEEILRLLLELAENKMLEYEI